MKFLVRKKKIKKMKGISQVIAIILLIGLAIIAGAALFLVVIPLLSTQTPIELSTSNQAVFSTTEKTQLDPFIDTMKFQLSNDIIDPVQIDLTHSYVYNASNNLILYHWTPQSNNTEPVLSGKQGITLEYKTDAIRNIEELNYGQQVYIKFNATLYGQQKYTLIKSKVYTVSSANSNPIFDISPNNHFNQSGTTVFFDGYPNQSVSTYLSLSVWNKGNANKTYTKTISIYLENSIYFKIESQYQTQTVTIPSSTQIGQGGVCYSGDPCAIVNFPITRVNLTALGISSINKTYGAGITLTGLDTIYYTLNVTTPRLISLVLPDSLVAKGTGNGRIANSNLIFNGPFNANNSLDLTITIWNADTTPLNANIFVKRLNTTAFALDSPNVTSIYIPNGTMPSTINTCNPGDPCTTVTWTITRLPLTLNGQSTGIQAGAYDISLNFLEFGASLPVVLFINGPGQDVSPYIYVNSVTWTKDTKKNDLSATVEIWDANFNTVGGATVTATWKMPDGTTRSLIGTTKQNGQVTFTESLLTGTHILTITDVSNTGNIYDPTRNHLTNNQSIYTVNTNYVYISGFNWDYTAPTKTKPSVLQALLTVNDQTNNPISGVSVTIQWEVNGVNQSTTITGTTQTIGKTKGAVTFSLSSVTSGFNYSIYIINVSLTNYDYQSSSNTVTFPQSFTIP